jgi:hypothetical protein
MVYTLLAEPRSGGTDLMDWFGAVLSGFTIAQEPYLRNSLNLFSHTEDVTDVKWIDEHKNVFIREIFERQRDFTNLINRSDKVFCLYRKNWYAQTKSKLFVQHHDEYKRIYTKKEMDELVSHDMVVNHYQMEFSKDKNAFQDFIKSHNLMCVSYEDLYYQNDIQKVIDFLNLKTDIKFPLSVRHLKTEDNKPEPLDKLPPSLLI